MSYSLEILSKPNEYLRNYKSDSVKYYLSKCDEKIKKNGNTKSWLEVTTSLKKRVEEFDKSRVLEGILDNKLEVVVKIGSSNSLERECYFVHKLKSLKGFIRFICCFNCNDNYLNYPNQDKRFLCDGPGNTMGIIIMPYYKLGSISNYIWTSDNIHILHSLIKQTIINIYIAFTKFNILHGDLHSDNVCIKKTNTEILKYNLEQEIKIEIPSYGFRSVLMDLENSSNVDIENSFEYNKILQNYYMDFKKFFFTIFHDIKNLNGETFKSIDVSIYDLLINQKEPYYILEILEIVNDIRFNE